MLERISVDDESGVVTLAINRNGFSDRMGMGLHTCEAISKQLAAGLAAVLSPVFRVSSQTVVNEAIAQHDRAAATVLQVHAGLKVFRLAQPPMVELLFGEALALLPSDTWARRHHSLPNSA